MKILKLVSLVTQDSLSVFIVPGFWRSVLGMRRKIWDVPSFLGNLKCDRDGPFPSEKVLGAERNGIAFVPEAPFRWEHHGHQATMAKRLLGPLLSLRKFGVFPAHSL